MGLEDIAKGIKQTLKAAVVVGTLAGPAHGQQPKKTPEQPRVEEPELRGITPPDIYFNIDDYVSSTEGTPEERRQLAEELYAMILQRFEKDEDGIKEKLFPLTIGNESLNIRVQIRSSHQYKELRIIVFHPSAGAGDDNIHLIDANVTGTPSEYQLPIIEKGIPRPQRFAIQGEHPLANRLYLGLLRQLLSKF
ncbi:hypothetical protein HY968_03045 [Candidatus Kaiserbacteria bacterium]|nr:hypothetical protein [Candidatus Kaiserbacteria bacterium]